MGKRTFREALLFYKAQLKLKQLPMSELVGLKLRFYQKLESGESEPSLETLTKVLDGLGVSFEELMNRPAPVDVLPAHIAKKLIKYPDEELPYQATQVMMAKFGASPEKLRAVVLAYLYQDFEILRPYQADLAGLTPKPKAR